MESRKLFLWIVACVLLLNGCNYKEDIVVPQDVIISIKSEPGIIVADGVSKSLITVRLPDKTLDTKRSIILTTTKGLFEVEGKNTTTITAGNVVTPEGTQIIGYATLISSADAGTATVKAASGNFSRSVTINFTTAFPDAIHLQVDKNNYKPDAASEVTVTIVLNRNIGTGTVSSGQTVTLSVVDSLNNPIGQFRNKILLTDASGKCVNYFSLPLNNTYLGKITATATTVNSANQTISDSAIITVIK